MADHRQHSGAEAVSSGRGQILVLTALLLGILLAFAAVLVDGGHGLLVRRQLQNASDAAALAGANVIQATASKRCGASAGGSPYPEVRAAALASVAANLPSYDPAAVEVTCPTGWGNVAVSVQLAADSPTFFGRIINDEGLQVATNATAIHGRSDGGTYNIVELNPGPPHTAGWPQARNGCPSLALNGGVSLTLEGSVHLNSACLESAGGAFATKGGSASLTMSPGAVFRMVGEYRRQALTINPPPLEHQRPLSDPLSHLSNDLLRSPPLPVQRTTKWVINGQTVVLEPGVYRGGIELRSHAALFLTPGVYVIEGGGLDVGAQATVRAIPTSMVRSPKFGAPLTGDEIPTTTAASWESECTTSNCGVLIYNTSGASGIGQVSVGAGASVQLRAFNPSAPTTGFTFGEPFEDYRHLLFWQARSPAPGPSYAQPPVLLSGGGSVFMSGTIYAPGALVRMGGTSGGGGGDVIDLTLQFISWDLEFAGNVSFVFRYSSDTFVLPLQYGLVE
jgi:Flp pilus assembly protein TadG